jgi:gliding motility-associated-like protein
MAVEEYGCATSADVRVEVIFEKGLYVPNAFSPNGDGLNDIFTIYGKESNIQIQKLEIFNRWGAPVFQARDFPPNSEVGWDGFFNGRLMNASVFVWRAEVAFPDGRVELLKGDLTLLR